MTQEYDYYAILQVHPRAEKEVIEAAYRRLATKYHPDRNSSPEATRRMKEINAAYEVLSDPEKRRWYDASRRLGSTVPSGIPGFRPGVSPSMSKAIRMLLPFAVFAVSLIIMRLSPGLGLFVLLALLALWTYNSAARRRQ
ncbi:MAG: J domain-containing protein [Chloroflexi bacterium]|nr:J domain-containing protein [Chloroflexota bacterium]